MCLSLQLTRAQITVIEVRSGQIKLTEDLCYDIANATTESVFQPGEEKNNEK